MSLWWILWFCSWLEDNTQKGRCYCSRSWWNFLYKYWWIQQEKCLRICPAKLGHPPWLQVLPHRIHRPTRMCPVGCSSLQPCQCTWRNAPLKTHGFYILTPLCFMSWAEAFWFILISFLNLSLVNSRLFTIVLLSAAVSEDFGDGAWRWSGQDRFNSSCCPLYSVIIAGIMWIWRVWGFFFPAPQMFLFRENTTIT